MCYDSYRPPKMSSSTLHSITLFGAFFGFFSCQWVSYDELLIVVYIFFSRPMCFYHKKLLTMLRLFLSWASPFFSSLHCSTLAPFIPFSVDFSCLSSIYRYSLRCCVIVVIVDRNIYHSCILMIIIHSFDLIANVFRTHTHTFMCNLYWNTERKRNETYSIYSQFTQWNDMRANRSSGVSSPHCYFFTNKRYNVIMPLKSLSFLLNMCERVFVLFFCVCL